FGASSLAASPGATVSTTLWVTSPTVPTGSYTIVGAAVNGALTSLSGSAAMVYAVVPAGGSIGGPGSFTDGFDRLDNSTLDNGWVVVTGKLKVQSGEARNEASAAANLVVQPGLSGGTQTVTTSFASTNNNTSPRFGVLM